MDDYSHNKMDLNGSKECGRNNLAEITKIWKVAINWLKMIEFDHNLVVVKIRLDW